MSVAVEQHRALGGGGRRPAEGVQQFAPVVVHQHDPARVAGRIEHGCAHAQRRLVRDLDPVALDVEIERRDVDLADGDRHRVGEEIPPRLVLQPVGGNDFRAAVRQLDPHPFHPRLVDPADLVVDPLAVGERQKALGQRRDRRRPVGVHGATQRTVRSQEADIADDAVDGVGNRLDAARDVADLRLRSSVPRSRSCPRPGA
ncbi:MAG: hypothetical protein IPJ62_03190 [Betaproteobacteria bacterium]|nr:hypothetical protein [Betaproteobacteria bacterium]